MTDMTWEERMAKRAHDRAYARTAVECAESRAEYEAQKEAYVQAYVDTLTPESAAQEQAAVEANPIGCACIGGPRCCIIRAIARNRVLNQ